MSFKNSEEVRHYMGGIFETAFAHPETGPKLAETGLILRFDFAEPETILIVDMGGHKILPEGEAVESSARMSMTADTGNAYWQGKVNLALAMAKSRIKVDGNVASLLKLAPLAKKLYPIYIENLRKDGRDDLLVK